VVWLATTRSSPCFFFSSRRRHTSSKRDWSSDVCSSDLQAVLGMPDIIILDEPTVGLDPIQIIEIRDLIKELGKKHTVILSSHILSEVSAVCDHIMIISHGKLVASDTPENLMQMMKGGHTLEMLIKAEPARVKDILNVYETNNIVSQEI